MKWLVALAVIRMELQAGKSFNLKSLLMAFDVRVVMGRVLHTLRR
jgi:hypothetical protein